MHVVFLRPHANANFRRLSDALPQRRRTTALLLTLAASDVRAAQTKAPANIAMRTAWEWMLEG
jgi:hypothetical protein